MTDHKFTVDEIIKALECCAEAEYCATCHATDSCKGMDSLMENALALINRQKAQIDELKVELDAMRGAANSYKMHYEETERKYKIAVAEREANVEGFIETLKTIKSEAIKEFAERLKSDFGRIPQHQFTRSQIEWSINTLVEEMTEGNNE
jgi:hypothetical protein